MKSKVNTDEKKIDELLSRGVEDVIIRESLKKKLLSGRELRVKMGIDPTGPKIHLGRAVALRKLAKFQELGHKIVLIVGDFTALIGDASDKLEKRPMLTVAEVKKNMKDYKSQLGKIIDLKKAEFHYNSKWLKKLNALDLSELAESFSVLQMSNRRNFKDRLDKGEEVSLREFLYPLYQGYDSVAVKADVEIGGFDQLFNLKAGRIVQKHYHMSEQDILTIEMLEGTDGRKMSTSWGNIITVVDEPTDMFGKVMSVRDELVPKYFKLCTDMETPPVGNPKEIKMKLAREIVKIYHGEKKAEEAEQSFINTFQKKEIPENIEEIQVAKGESLADVLVNNKILSSKGEWRRLVEGRGAHDLLKNENISDPTLKVNENMTLKIGKKRFLKIIVK